MASQLPAWLDAAAAIGGLDMGLGDGERGATSASVASRWQDRVASVLPVRVDRWGALRRAGYAGPGFRAAGRFDDALPVFADDPGVLFGSGVTLAMGRLWLEHVVVDDPADLVGNQHDLERFVSQGGQIRLVSDLGSGKLAGIGFKGPGDWNWDEVRLEEPAGRLFRETAISLITQQITQVAPGVTLPSGLDDALNGASAVLSPQIVLGKLANAAAQAVACHLGLAHIAPAAGKVAEQVVISLPSPGGMQTKALGLARAGAVAYDLEDGHLTATVRDFIADKLNGRVSDLTRGVTPPEIQAMDFSALELLSEGDGEIRGSLHLLDRRSLRPADPSRPPPEPPPPPPPPEDPVWSPGGL